MNSDYHRILTIGPTFEINAFATVVLDTSIELQTELSFTTEGTKIVFPSRDGDNLVQGIKPGTSSMCFFLSSYRFVLADNRVSDLKLSATPSVNATGNAEVHIVPQVQRATLLLANRGLTNREGQPGYHRVGLGRG